MTARDVRLASGLILLGYIASHFLSHATGLFGPAAMDGWGLGVILSVWRTPPGHVLIFTALFVHAAFGIVALWRRRHLRIPLSEAIQLGFGLMIPLLLLPHAANVRIGSLLFGLHDDYDRILYQYWFSSTSAGLVRQFTLLFVAWIHGCIGLRFWLRRRASYDRFWPWLMAVAAALPLLAILGLVNAGWGMSVAVLTDPGFVAEHATPPVGSEAARAAAAIPLIWTSLQAAWMSLVAAVLLIRYRRYRRNRALMLNVTYPDGRVIRVPRGFSVLEASRWGRMPHAAACGGRGRCSTCRVRVTQGLDWLPAPTLAERATLTRIRAGSAVRLACQIRPEADLTVVPLLPADLAPVKELGIPLGEASERLVTALAIDLRNSTRLAAEHPPFDAIFTVDRYIRCVSAAVQKHGGIVTSVAGDGIMSVFAARSGGGARDAMAAALAIWTGMDQLNDELEHGLGLRLTCGEPAELAGGCNGSHRSPLSHWPNTSATAAGMRWW